MDPATRQKLIIFKKQKRAYWSLIVLVILFVLCLPAELICNSKPLFISYQGKWYFPVFKRYTQKDFGGNNTIEPQYHSQSFRILVGLEAAPPTKEDDVNQEDFLNSFGGMDMGGGEETEEEQETEDLTSKSEQPDQAAFVLYPPIPYDYKHIDMSTTSGAAALASPWRHENEEGEAIKSSWVDQHYLGTDDRNRDVLARLIYGFRVSVIFGVLLAISGTTIGCIIGAIQGYFGGYIDLLGQRAMEMWESLPQLYLLMILSSILSPGVVVLFFILLLTSWMGMARFMRAEYLRGRSMDYVRAARALGVQSHVIMFRHILPNALTPVVTFFPFAVSGAILALVSLDFLGLGVPSPYPSLGELLRQGRDNLGAIWISIPTVLTLCGLITLLTFIGDGLRNAFDPRRSEKG